MPDGGSASVELEGDSERSFAVTLRFRGVLERKSYMGGDPDPPFLLGGEPVVDTWNAWALHVSDPALVIRLNPGTSGDLVCVPLEEVRTVVVSGGAKLLLEASAGGDTCGVTNDDGTGTPISFDGMEPFDGQFVEVEILGITPKP